MLGVNEQRCQSIKACSLQAYTRCVWIMDDNSAAEHYGQCRL